MIEVERQFQPTVEQLSLLLEGAEFLGQKVNHDVYYDYPDYRFFKGKIQLRNRDGSFELKLGKSDSVKEEIESEVDICRYFQVSSLSEFIEANLISIVDYKSTRNQYKKGEFNLTLDEMDFGYKICEIELMVENEEQVKGAEEKIIALATKFNLELKELHTKRAEYFRIAKPEVYKELFGDK